MTNCLGIDIDYSRDSLFDSFGLHRMKEGYMAEDEKSPQERFAFVSKAFSSNPEHAQRLYDYSSNHWLSYATPVLTYGKEKRGLPVSCYLSNLNDSRESLVNTLSEVNWLSMMGGGVGVGVNIRAADKKSVGVIPHLKTYDASVLAYRQGETRRGSYAMYLDLHHPDIVKFIEMRKPTGDQNARCMNLHHGVNIPDSFMQIIENCMTNPDADDTWNLIDDNTGQVKDKISAKWLWELLLTTRLMTGEPYFHFIDASNRALPQWQKEKGLRIKQSNLCVSGSTQVMTKKGYSAIIDLVGTNVEVWNGAEWSEASPFKTGSQQKVLKVTFSNGMDIVCTPYHKFYVQNKYKTSNGHTTVKEKMAEDLSIGDKLEKWLLPIVQESNLGEFPDSYTQGFFTGDGCSYKGKNHIDVYGDKVKILPKLKFTTINSYMQSQDRFRVYIDKSYIKHRVPFGYTLKSKLDWLAGLCDADATLTNADGFNLTLATSDNDFAKSLVLFLQELGVNAKINRGQSEGYRMMPDGKGGNAPYLCKQGYRVCISGSGLQTLMQLGFKTYRINLSNVTVPNRNAERFVKVVSIEDAGFEDTYCLTEEKRHRVLFNGILTGNCNEIFLPTNEERTAVCCLSSLNLEYYDEYKDSYQFFRDVAEMLDNVLTTFIDKAPDSIKRARYSASQERSIGVGTLGFHAFLQSKNIPFESVMAKVYNKKIYANIKENLWKANVELGTERGECPDAKGYGYRFSHTTAIAPNASTSTLLGNTSPSIEPYASNIYKQETISGPNIVRNRFLDKKIAELGLDKDAVWYEILASRGSIQNLTYFDDLTKEVFKTSKEIDQRWVIDLAADRQEFVDQGQSVNLFFYPDTTISYLHEVHFQAWKKGMKGLYYVRTEKIGKIDNLSKQIKRVDLTIDSESSTCLACEG